MEEFKEDLSENLIQHKQEFLDIIGKTDMKIAEHYMNMCGNDLAVSFLI